MEHSYAVIMAGGGGTRLWPLSRKERPKQLLPLVERATLFQSTVARLETLFPPERILVVTVEEQARQMRAQAPHIPSENYLLEPAPRGTASVVGLAAAVLQKRDPRAAMAVLPSDHFIRNRELFHALLQAAFEVAQDGYLTTLGITPTAPSVSYGYIQQGEPLEKPYSRPVYRVKRFKEKPDENTAREMLRAGGHSWNSGMFIWRADAILGEIEKQMPALHRALTAIAEAYDSPARDAALSEHWTPLETVTVDYGIMENAARVAVLPAEGLGWSDVGLWSSLFEALPADADGNVAANDSLHLAHETRHTLVYSADPQKLIVTIGVEDMAIVDVGDVTLVCKADQAQKVKDVVEALKKRGQEKYL